MTPTAYLDQHDALQATLDADPRIEVGTRVRRAHATDPRRATQLGYVVSAWIPETNANPRFQGGVRYVEVIFPAAWNDAPRDVRILVRAAAVKRVGDATAARAIADATRRHDQAARAQRQRQRS